MTGTDPDEQVRRMAAESLAANDATGWFERLYVAAGHGAAVVPWDRAEPQRLLVEWARSHRVEGTGRRAIVVGCGFGADAEYVAGLGFDTLAFDISATAVREARRRFPDSGVRYVAADMLDPPAAWRGAFDLVVESYNVQALPGGLRADAIARVRELVAPGGTLVVIAFAGDEAAAEGPPWPLTPTEVEAFGDGGLRPVRIEDLRDATQPGVRRWRAEFRRHPE